MNSQTGKKSFEGNTFLKIPGALLVSPKYRTVSAEAKLMYAMMCSRKGISEINNWKTPDGRTFIYYTVKEICEVMGCGHTKAVKLLDELDISGGVGLIERKKQGNGKPNMIFLYDVCDNNSSVISEDDELPENRETCVDKIVDNPVGNCVDKHVEGYVENFDENHTYNPTERGVDSFVDNHVDTPVDNHVDNISGEHMFFTSQNQTSAKRTSCIPQNGTPDFRKTESIYIDNNYINKSYIDNIISDPVVSDMNRREKYDVTDWMEKRKAVKNSVMKNIDYEVVVYNFGKNWADEITELMTEVICSDAKYIRINKTDYPQEAVAERFMNIRYRHIDNVYSTTHTTTRYIGNIRSYLITTIYRSFETAESWITARVNADMNRE